MGYKDLNELRKIKKSLKKLYGVYFLWSNNKLVYVGQSSNGTSRIGDHREDKAYNYFTWLTVPIWYIDSVEKFYINKYRPKYNKVCGDFNKVHLMKFFNVNEETLDKMSKPSEKTCRSNRPEPKQKRCVKDAVKRVVIKKVLEPVEEVTDSPLDPITQLRVDRIADKAILNAKKNRSPNVKSRGTMGKRNSRSTKNSNPRRS